MAHPTFTQPEALRLAAELDPLGGAESEAADELRRLYAANIDCVDHFNALKAERDELLDAVKDLLEDTEHKHHSCGDEDWCPVLRARAALAKASGSATQTGETE